MTSFPSDKYNALVEAIQAQVYSSPNECLAQLSAINDIFRKVLDQDFAFSSLAENKRNQLRDLAERCAPIVDYYVVKSHRFSNERIDSLVPVYSLRIRSSASDLAGQAEELYATAIDSLSNPVLKSGVTLSYILAQLVDRYSQEAGVDEPAEIERIAGRLVSRFFTDAAEAPQPSAPVAKTIQPVQGKGVYSNFAEAMAYVKSLREIASKWFIDSNLGCNTNIVAMLKWIAPPAIDIKAEVMPLDEPVMDNELGGAIILFPKVRYSISTDAKQLERNLSMLVRFFKKSNELSLLRTSLTAIREDLKSIPQLPPQDISISLRKVIEDNFNVTLIEIDNEADRYATPEYFEATRSNVDRVVTTRPAVIDADGKVLLKGRYVVPMA